MATNCLYCTVYVSFLSCMVTVTWSFFSLRLLQHASLLVHSYMVILLPYTTPACLITGPQLHGHSSLSDYSGMPHYWSTATWSFFSLRLLQHASLLLHSYMVILLSQTTLACLITGPQLHGHSSLSDYSGMPHYWSTATWSFFSLRLLWHASLLVHSYMVILLSQTTPACLITAPQLHGHSSLSDYSSMPHYWSTATWSFFSLRLLQHASLLVHSYMVILLSQTTLVCLITGPQLHGHSSLSDYSSMPHYWSTATWSFFSLRLLRHASLLLHSYMVILLPYTTPACLITGPQLHGHSSLSDYSGMPHYCSTATWSFFSLRLLQHASLLLHSYMVILLSQTTLVCLITGPQLHGHSSLSDYSSMPHYWSTATWSFFSLRLLRHASLLLHSYMVILLPYTTPACLITGPQLHGHSSLSDYSGMPHYCSTATWSFFTLRLLWHASLLFHSYMVILLSQTTPACLITGPQLHGNSSLSDYSDMPYYWSTATWSFFSLTLLRHASLLVHSYMVILLSQTTSACLITGPQLHGHSSL